MRPCRGDRAPLRLEIPFSGRLLAARSPEISEIRRAVVTGEIPDPDGGRGAPGWVSRTFDQDYGRTSPR